MTLSTILEIAIGLMLIYYVLGLIVNIFMSIIKDLVEIRANALEDILKKTLQEDTFNKLISNSLIKNLKPSRSGIVNWIKGGNFKVSDIPKGTFSLALLEALHPEKKDFLVKEINKVVSSLLIGETDPNTITTLQGLLGLDFEDDEQLMAGIRTAVSNLPPGNKQDALLKLIDFVSGTPETQLAAIRAGIEEMPDNDTKKALQNIINFGTQDINEVRKRLESWYDDTMRNVSGYFTQKARTWVIILSFIITIGVGTDSIAIGTALWERPTRANDVQETLSGLVDEFESGDLSASKLEGLSADEIENRISRRVGDIQSILVTIDSLDDVPITWEKPSILAPILRENWPQDSAGVWSKVLGLLLTWIAVSQGSSFWYDILKKVNPTSPSTSNQEGSQTGTAES